MPGNATPAWQAIQTCMGASPQPSEMAESRGFGRGIQAGAQFMSDCAQIADDEREYVEANNWRTAARHLLALQPPGPAREEDKSG